MAHLKWLYSPRHFSITDQRVLTLAPQYYRELGKKDPSGPPDWEPHFEDDAYAELGHAYESHVRNRPLLEDCADRKTFRFWAAVFGPLEQTALAQAHCFLVIIPAS